MKKRTDWKYLFREIILIFIGINLAIWFNNWNENRKLNRELTNSIELTQKELESNLATLSKNKEIPEKFYNELNTYFSVSEKRTGIEIEQFNSENEMIRITSDGGLKINFKYPILNLKTTSWSIFKSRNSFHKLKYDCVDEIESCYQLIERFQDEFKISHMNLRNGEIEKFKNTLNYVIQINPQLQNVIQSILKDIKTCS